MEHQGDLLNSSQNTKVSSNVFRALFEYQPTRNFLPSLRGLTVTQGACDILPFIHHFIGLSLVNVIIDYDMVSQVPDDTLSIRVNDDLILLLDSLPRTSPSLQSLIFDDSEITGDFDMALWNAAIHLHNLQHLEVPEMRLPINVVTHLASLPCLERLSMVRIEPDDVQHYTTQHGGFPRLIDFAFHVDVDSTVPAILDLMRCKFRSLKINAWCPMEYHSRMVQLARTFLLLNRHHRLNLRKLHYVQLATLGVPVDSDDDVIKKAFLPLFSLPLLQEVHLYFSLGGDPIDRSWLFKAAQAWPLLESLDLSFSLSLNPQPRVTLEGLIPLLKSCPALSYLKLLLEVKTVPMGIRDGVCSYHTRRIDVALGSTITNALDVYPSIISMFPNLEYVYDDQSLREIWNHAQHALHQEWIDLNQLLRPPSRTNYQLYNKTMAC